ncbi:MULTISPECIES: YezD family protein [Methylotenera]|uniref:YezD family protein n=1 Tax=Methylotenera TaxID=359407 RepID=UPI00037230B8|nr:MULTISPECIES: DUF2292 domain-containing protein [Methylotenera]
MSQIKHKSLDNKQLDNDDETLQAILRAVISVQRETGFGSIEITVHEGRVTQIEKREKIRITHDKSEKQGLDKHHLDRQNLEKQSSHKQSLETLSINKQKSELSTALHN